MKLSLLACTLGLALTVRADGGLGQNAVIAHGLLMSLAFLIFFPLGALTVRLFSFRNLVWVHAGTQIFAYLVALAGFGLGVWIAVTTQQLNSAHPIIGIVVIALLLFQPVLGLVHHYIYRRSQRRTVWAWGHIWFGRALLILGAINGGLGLQLADNTVKGEIAYGVIAGVVFLFYVTVVGVSYMRQRGRGGRGEGETGEKFNAIPTPASDGSPADSQTEMRARY